MSRANDQSRLRVAAALIIAVIAVCFATARDASAHPLDEPPIDQHVGVYITPTRVEITHIALISELIAFREIPAMDRDGDFRADADELAPYAETTCADRAADVVAAVDDGDRLALDRVRSAAAFEKVSSTLGRIRVTCTYEAPWSPALDTTVGLAVTNEVLEGWPGWTEVVVDGSGVRIRSDAPSVSPTAKLTTSPEAAIAPLRTALVSVVVDGSAVQVRREQGTPGEQARLGMVDGFVTGDRAGIGALLLAVAGALGLGAIHALAPGHGKTLMAAYLVGSRGTSLEASVLALTVAAAHTAGVAVLGWLAWRATEWSRPESIYPYLALVSALVVVGVGIGLAVRFGRHDPSHDHDHAPAAPGPSSRVTWRMLVALGLSGGLVPSASAVILLLGALSLGRPAVGLMLVALFGLGMAVALVTVGVAVVRARDIGLRRLTGRIPAAVWHQAPGLAAGVVILVGLGLVVRAVSIIVT